jgi:LPS export ABC transporter protein LptC
VRFLFPLFISILFLFCGEEEKEQIPPPTGEQEIEKFQIVETRWGKKSFALTAKILEERNDTTWVFKFKVVFFDEKGERVSTLTADSGAIFKKTGDMMALGNVLVKTVEGVELISDELLWKEDIRKIVTDKEVLIKRDGKVLKGKGLVSDPGLKHIEIKGKVRGYE